MTKQKRDSSQQQQRQHTPQRGVNKKKTKTTNIQNIIKKKTLLDPQQTSITQFGVGATPATYQGSTTKKKNPNTKITPSPPTASINNELSTLHNTNDTNAPHNTTDTNKQQNNIKKKPSILRVNNNTHTKHDQRNTDNNNTEAIPTPTSPTRTNQPADTNTATSQLKPASVSFQNNTDERKKSPSQSSDENILVDTDESDDEWLTSNNTRKQSSTKGKVIYFDTPVQHNDYKEKNFARVSIWVTFVEPDGETMHQHAQKFLRKYIHSIFTSSQNAVGIPELLE